MVCLVCLVKFINCIILQELYSTLKYYSVWLIGNKMIYKHSKCPLFNYPGGNKPVRDV